jgi:hypothetical protein
VTLGHECKSDVTGRTVPRRECCWVNHFTAWVRARYPAATITIRNKALSGCSSFCQLPQLSQTLPRDQPVDIVVLDMSSNDAMASDFSGAPGRHEGIRKHIRNVYNFFIYMYICIWVYTGIQHIGCDLCNLVQQHVCIGASLLSVEELHWQHSYATRHCCIVHASLCRREHS